MERIFSLLEKHRLESYYLQFQQLGVKDERDFIDGVTEEDLTNLGLTHVEKKRFRDMKESIGRLRAPAQQASDPVQPLRAFRLRYTFPKCSEPRLITDMDPAQNTVEDLMLRIGFTENIGASKGVCLYTVDGMPLTDDPFFNTWSLQDRYINNEDLIYAIFTPKENLLTPQESEMNEGPVLGTNVVRCHVMLRGDFEVNVDLPTDSLKEVSNKLAVTSGIPAHVLHYKGDPGCDNSSEALWITEETTLHFSLSALTEQGHSLSRFFHDNIIHSVQQTKKGISVFFSSLYVIVNSETMSSNHLISYIRKVTGCNPLAQGLHQLLVKNQILSRSQKIAVIEGLYTLFREILPKHGSTEGDVYIEDHEVFENCLFCWAYLMGEAKKENLHCENYAPYSLLSEDGTRFCEPVTVPGVPGAMERAVVLQKIKDDVKIPHCTEQMLTATSLKRCTDIEKILLSVHPLMLTYDLWIGQDSVTGQNFQLGTKKTLAVMAEEMKAFPQINVFPPLRLMDLGCRAPCLVYLSKDNLGVYQAKEKGSPQKVMVHDFLSDEDISAHVDNLAEVTGDYRQDFSLVTTRTPKEAILVLIDTSSSMTEKSYGSVDIQKIHAVKELFNSFANRSMAYDFHHIIGLVKFNSTVETLQTFTEALETFKDSVQTLRAAGQTKLYDALHHGTLELETVKTKFPKCKLRILCLTDGNDVGSTHKPVDVAVSLIKSDITLDSVLVGKVENNMLHGISIASGGCCFKPNTSKDGLKLFETETVLSSGIRKPKNKADPSSVTEGFLNGLIAIHGYDDIPEALLPSEISNKVTQTEDALKKKLKEAKDGRFMEKDRRILEELKNLHCHPHPYFQIFPSENDFTFWKLLMEGPPDTPYESGVFELFCQFGSEYPVKPPTVRFVTSIYHCNINNVGRICHNIFDRGYNAHITMREILNAVYGLLTAPEPDDPLDSVLAEEYMTSREKYDEEAKKHTQKSAGQSLDEKEKNLVEMVKPLPEKFICPLTKKIFVDPVITKYGDVYERKAIEKHLKRSKYDPFAKPQQLLRRTDCKPCPLMKKLVTEYRTSQILETSV